MNYASVITADHPIRWYRGGTTDSGSQGQNGTVVGTPTLGVTGLLAGDSQTATNFGGQGYISIPTTGLPTGAQPWSMECWVKWTTLSGTFYDLIMDIGSHVTGKEASLYYDIDTGDMANAIFGNGEIDASQAIQANVVYYCVASYDGTNTIIDLYSLTNGLSSASAAKTPNITYGTATFGGSPNNTGIPFNGIGQDFAFYDYALSKQQKQTHFVAGAYGTLTRTLPTDGMGIYDYTGTDMSSATYQPRLQRIAAGGFKLVMNYSILYGSTAQMIAYINYAASLGMKVIVNLKEPWIWLTPAIQANAPTMYTESGNQTTDSGFTNYVINQVKNLPGTWGYYVADEAQAGNHAALKTHCDIVHTADSTKPRLDIENWSVDGDAFYTQLSPEWDCAEICGDDYYPASFLPNTSITAVVASGIQKYATTKSFQPAIVLQAFSTDGSIYPSISDMRNNMIIAEQFMQPRLILWYSYQDILGSDNPTLRWNNLVAVVKGSQKPIGNHRPFTRIG